MNELKNPDNSNLPKGVYITVTPAGKTLYRASVTHRGRHISLGSYPSVKKAHSAYLSAAQILQNNSITLNDFQDFRALKYEKAVSLINFRDNGLYFRTPIYLRKDHFNYYLSPDEMFSFDLEDLFYFASHSIQKRGGHFFVSDYGSQITLGTRFGLKTYSVTGRDNHFINGDDMDFRRINLEISNIYHGVVLSDDKRSYIARIHTSGYTRIGVYPTALEAAIAYNKAVDILRKKGSDKKFPENYIGEISGKVYAEIYNSLTVNPRLSQK